MLDQRVALGKPLGILHKIHQIHHHHCQANARAQDVKESVGEAPHPHLGMTLEGEEEGDVHVDQTNDDDGQPELRRTKLAIGEAELVLQVGVDVHIHRQGQIQHIGQQGQGEMGD